MDGTHERSPFADSTDSNFRSTSIGQDGSGASVQLLNIAPIRERLGPRWEHDSELVYTLLANAIALGNFVFSGLEAVPQIPIAGMSNW